MYMYYFTFHNDKSPQKLQMALSSTVYNEVAIYIKDQAAMLRDGIERWMWPLGALLSKLIDNRLMKKESIPLISSDKRSQSCLPHLIIQC
ncbi:hypothetical protein TNIN_338521 [Trichonephila inaurata madagascariensis]|uniref:Uncharacterized protein n=1 Tax=Trichonephila inaurata madagascariensis TaxID=2747483 RepID=A0A8X6Y096_9ARAC|nr:hypothetical protein TNIN_338521 [Trichonephila inaurata madagascariensis]